MFLHADLFQMSDNVSKVNSVFLNQFNVNIFWCDCCSGGWIHILNLCLKSKKFFFLSKTQRPQSNQNADALRCHHMNVCLAALAGTYFRTFGPSWWKERKLSIRAWHHATSGVEVVGIQICSYMTFTVTIK